MRDITEIINESINEAKLKELADKDVIGILKKYGFTKNDYIRKGVKIYAKDEDIAMEISDELVDEYVVTYDDKDDFKLSIFK